MEWASVINVNTLSAFTQTAAGFQVVNHQLHVVLSPKRYGLLLWVKCVCSEFTLQSGETRRAESDQAGLQAGAPLWPIRIVCVCVCAGLYLFAYIAKNIHSYILKMLQNWWYPSDFSCFLGALGLTFGWVMIINSGPRILIQGYGKNRGEDKKVPLKNIYSYIITCCYVMLWLRELLSTNHLLW